MSAQRNLLARWLMSKAAVNFSRVLNALNVPLHYGSERIGDYGVGTAVWTGYPRAA